MRWSSALSVVPYRCRPCLIRMSRFYWHRIGSTTTTEISQVSNAEIRLNFGTKQVGSSLSHRVRRPSERFRPSAVNLRDKYVPNQIQRRRSRVLGRLFDNYLSALAPQTLGCPKEPRRYYEKGVVFSCADLTFPK